MIYWWLFRIYECSLLGGIFSWPARIASAVQGLGHRLCWLLGTHIFSKASAQHGKCAWKPRKSANLWKPIEHMVHVYIQ